MSKSPVGAHIVDRRDCACEGVPVGRIYIHIDRTPNSGGWGVAVPNSAKPRTSYGSDRSSAAIDAMNPWPRLGWPATNKRKSKRGQ